MIQDLSSPGSRVDAGYFSNCNNKTQACFPQSSHVPEVEAYNNMALCGEVNCDLAAL